MPLTSSTSPATGSVGNIPRLPKVTANKGRRSAATSGSGSRSTDDGGDVYATGQWPRGCVPILAAARALEHAEAAAGVERPHRADHARFAHVGRLEVPDYGPCFMDDETEFEFVLQLLQEGVIS